MELSFYNVDKFCAGIDLAADPVIVDLSGYTFFKPFALVYLGLFLRYHTANGIKFEFKVPDDLQFRTYLDQQRYWLRFNCNIETLPRERLNFLSEAATLNDILDIDNRPNIVEDVADQVLRILTNSVVKVDNAAVVEIVSELVDNFTQHAETPLAAMVLQYYPERHQITIGFGDGGIGFRASLLKNQKYEYLAVIPHYEAALKAYDPLASRIDERGVGLTYLREQVIKARGQLLLATGDGFVKINRHRTEMGMMRYSLPGVQIEVALPEAGWEI
jgi:anti-sigma regulatory factor (Ser/Thr protein kinase)